MFPSFVKSNLERKGEVQILSSIVIEVQKTDFDISIYNVPFNIGIDIILIMDSKDFQGTRKYKLITLALCFSIATFYLVAPFLAYDAYITVFFVFMIASFIALLDLTVHSIGSFKKINSVLDRVSKGSSHRLQNRPQLVHSITLPIYLEPTQVLIQSLKMLSGHRRAKTDYLIFLCLETKAPDCREKGQTLQKMFSEKFKSFECVYHELKEGQPQGKASNLQNCLYQMDHFFKQNQIDPNLVIFTTIDCDNWMPEAYFEQMELLLSKNDWKIDNFAFGADQMFSIDVHDVPMMSRGADFLIGCLGYFVYSSDRSELLSNYSLSYSTFKKIGFFDLNPDVNVNEQTYLRYKLLWKVEGIKVIKLPVIVNMCSSKTDKGYWADLISRFWVAVRHRSSFHVLSYSANVYIKNGFLKSAFPLIVQSSFRILQFLVGILPLLTHFSYRLLFNLNFSTAELLLYSAFFIFGTLNCVIYYALANRSAKTFYNQPAGVPKWRLIEAISLIYFILMITEIIALFVALIKNVIKPTVIQSAPKAALKKNI